MKKLADPEAWWDAIEPLLGDRRLTIALIFLALAGSFVVATASEIGIRVFNTNWDNTFGYAVQRQSQLAARSSRYGAGSRSRPSFRA